MKICAYDDDKSSNTNGGIAELIVSEDKPQPVRIPGQYWHGTKTAEHQALLTVYFVNTLYGYKNPDEERRAWNDTDSSLRS
jgi:dTDP-4-dehydrorhamnose 3,5-epimerase